MCSEFVLVSFSYKFPQTYFCFSEEINIKDFNIKFESFIDVGSADESLNPDILPSAWHLVSPVLEFIDISVPVPSSNLTQHFFHPRMPGSLVSSKDFL